MDDSNDRSHSRPPRTEDLARIGRALNEAGAKYLLIGGFAVVAYGAGRTTHDIDLLVEDSVENMRRVKEALGILEDNAVLEVRESDVREYGVVRVADEVVVDLMGRACGVTYEDAARDAVRIAIHGVSIPVASKETLIRTKDTYRPSDRADREFLERLVQEQNRSR